MVDNIEFYVLDINIFVVFLVLYENSFCSKYDWKMFIEKMSVVTD